MDKEVTKMDDKNDKNMEKLWQNLNEIFSLLLIPLLVFYFWYNYDRENGVENAMFSIAFYTIIAKCIIYLLIYVALLLVNKLTIFKINMFKHLLYIIIAASWAYGIGQYLSIKQQQLDFEKEKMDEISMNLQLGVFIFVLFLLWKFFS